jgi:hypothetical protein
MTREWFDRKHQEDTCLGPQKDYGHPPDEEEWEDDNGGYLDADDASDEEREYETDDLARDRYDTADPDYVDYSPDDPTFQIFW